MINSVSWASYVYTIALIVLIYYVIILSIYYRHEISKIFKAFTSGLPGDRERSEFKSDLTANGISSGDNKDGIESQTLRHYSSEYFFTEIKDYLEQAAHAAIVKEEILFALGQLLKKFDNSKLTQFQTEIETLIWKDCAEKCHINLSVDEVRMVWRG